MVILSTTLPRLAIHVLPICQSASRFLLAAFLPNWPATVQACLCDGRERIFRGRLRTCDMRGALRVPHSADESCHANV